MTTIKDITQPIYCGYHYIGDVNPVEYGGKWVHPTTGHIIVMTGKDDGLTDDKGRAIAIVESKNAVVFTVKRVREALRACCGDFDRLRKLPRDARRACILECMDAFGYSEPANEFPRHHKVETHRDSAALKAVDDFVRL